MPLSTTTFDVTVPPTRVFAFLSNPRNFVAADRKGPVIEQSDGPLGAGSWYVLAFDQLRVRVEYIEYEPERKVAVTVVMSGRGSGGQSGRQGYTLSGLDDGIGTHIQAFAEWHGGWLRWGPLVRASQSDFWRRMRKRIEATA